MSNEVQKEKVVLEPAYIIKLTVTLFATCLVVAGLLGFVNSITAERIADINWENTKTAMSAVVADPSSTNFTDALPVTDDMTAAAAAYGVKIDSVYGVQVNGADAGYAIKVVASGSQGSIEMMVGVDSDNAVTGVSIVKNSETSGIGSKVMNNEPLPSGKPVLDQFQGFTAADQPLSVGGNVEAMSGATVSSRGVTAGVNAALNVASVIG